jgi:hypothetical protein
MKIPHLDWESSEQKELVERDIVNCSRIIDRGLYFFEKLSDERQRNCFNDANQLCEWAYWVRSLAEISHGMSLWFKSIENIKALNAAAFIDHATLMVRITKQKQKEGMKLSEFDKAVLAHGKDKYYAVPYPDDKKNIGTHRSNDEPFKKTSIIMSKLLHQDEYSLLGLYYPLEKVTISFFETQSIFWKKDFQNEIVFLNKKFPEIITFFVNRYRAFPFDYDEVVWK